MGMRDDETIICVDGKGVCIAGSGMEFGIRRAHLNELFIS